ncbi:unnamed protein product [Didymodactylos carnosus]|uniref:Hexosyltransferase n=1 Tax=Didymodactylos carnosus TaxID=1234261 RepID=A0A815NWH9_9BILA|nr:unnamed protein product [Didymodactylos carnosus]CAF1438216.1 unnamed protein product [Didymodactylos carnosus]CAF3659153.1 unnamed protein product [Didymodactylos carnosus]CAF4315297.1 unnamed protein product [Didymodactylos carnosus]
MIVLPETRSITFAVKFSVERFVVILCLLVISLVLYISLLLLNNNRSQFFKHAISKNKAIWWSLNKKFIIKFQDFDKEFVQQQQQSLESANIVERFLYNNPPNTKNPICSRTNRAQGINLLMILVLSRALNFDYRMAIRSTWGRNIQRNGLQIQTVFFVGTDDSSQYAIRNEQVMFNDVVEVGIPENYPFVSHKELATLQWTRLFCPWTEFIFRADDDILLDTFLLTKYIKHHLYNISEENDGIYGWFRFNNSVHRMDKWAVTRQEYPSKIYPPYTFGIGYLMTNKTCLELVNAAKAPHHAVIRIGDVYITGILRELANVKYFDFIGLDYSYTFYDVLPCDDLFMDNPKLLICMSKLHVGIKGDPDEFFDVWDVILTRQSERNKITSKH